MKSTGVPIGEAAARYGLAPHVLRHWEAVGLLDPARVAGQRRRYAEADLARIALVVRAKQAGLSLDDIRTVLGSGLREVLDRRRVELRQRIEQARAELAMLECAAACEHDDPLTCPHLRDHAKGAPPEGRP